MIISNLDHLEVVEETSIIGGGYDYCGCKKNKKDNKPKKRSYKFPTVSVASATGDAVALGGDTNIAKTNTEAATGPGFAAASSSSFAASLGDGSKSH